MDSYSKRGYLNSDFRIFHLVDNLSQEFEYHYHEFHKITIFIKGNVQYFVEGKAYDLRPYDIVLVNRNDIHKLSVDNSIPYERIIVYISPSFIEAYQTPDYDLSFCFQKAKKEHSNVLRVQSLEKSSLFKITTRLERSFSDTEYASELYRQILFLEFMIQLNRAARKDTLEFLDTALYNTKIVDIMHYINENITDNLEIDTLSHKFYISKYYMMRLFKSETGYTINNYITYKRLLLAREFISQGTPSPQPVLIVDFMIIPLFHVPTKKSFQRLQEI